MLYRSIFPAAGHAKRGFHKLLKYEEKGRSEERPEFDREETSKKEEHTIRLDNQIVLRCNI